MAGLKLHDVIVMKNDTIFASLTKWVNVQVKDILVKYMSMF